MECCGSRCLQTNYSFICTRCGSEKMSYQPEMYLPGYGRSYSAMNKSVYSRRYRFHALLLKACNHAHGPVATDPIWSILEKHRGTYKTHWDILKVLSKTAAKNKRYDALPCFCRIFLPDYFRPRAVSVKQIQQAMVLFDRVEKRWKATRHNRFFSYYYILELILKQIGCGDCLTTCKKLICLKRRAYYDNLLETLGGFTQHVCGRGGI